MKKFLLKLISILLITTLSACSKNNETTYTDSNSSDSTISPKEAILVSYKKINLTENTIESEREYKYEYNDNGQITKVSYDVFGDGNFQDNYNQFEYKIDDNLIYAYTTGYHLTYDLNFDLLSNSSMGLASNPGTYNENGQLTGINNTATVYGFVSTTYDLAIEYDNGLISHKTKTILSRAEENTFTYEDYDNKFVQYVNGVEDDKSNVTNYYAKIKEHRSPASPSYNYESNGYILLKRTYSVNSWGETTDYEEYFTYECDGEIYTYESVFGE